MVSLFSNLPASINFVLFNSIVFQPQPLFPHPLLHCLLHACLHACCTPPRELYHLYLCCCQLNVHVMNISAPNLLFLQKQKEKAVAVHQMMDYLKKMST